MIEEACCDSAGYKCLLWNSRQLLWFKRVAEALSRFLMPLGLSSFLRTASSFYGREVVYRSGALWYTENASLCLLVSKRPTTALTSRWDMCTYSANKNNGKSFVIGFEGLVLTRQGQRLPCLCQLISDNRLLSWARPTLPIAYRSCTP